MKTNQTFIFSIAVVILCISASCSEKSGQIEYSTGVWDADSLGYHRVVLNVTKKAEAAYAHIEWRRRDKSPEEKGFILIDGISGKRIENVLSVNINREAGDIIFQPVSVPGEYYLYYLPGKPIRKSNYPKVKYPSPFNTADPVWTSKFKGISVENIAADKSITHANVTAIESRDEFNTFYPMEVIATREETDNLINANKDKDFLLFTEDRSLSIRMKEDLPLKWIADKPLKPVEGKAMRGEYFTFQLGVYPLSGDLRNVNVIFSGLTGKDGSVKIKPEDITCFNTEGRDWDGKKFRKSVDINKGIVQPLWCGVMIPDDIKKGSLSGTLTVVAENSKSETVSIRIDVINESAINHGDNNPSDMTRLRWLNSDLALNDELVIPFKEVTRDGNKLSILGRQLEINGQGFPEKYTSLFSPDVTQINIKPNEVLSGPMTLNMVTEKGGILKWENESLSFEKNGPGIIKWSSKNKAAGINMTVDGSLEADGFASLVIKLVASEETPLRNIHFNIPFSKEFSQYMMGLGLRGGLRPDRHSWKWDKMLHQEGAWIGGVNGGMQFALRDNKYVRPLNTNFYRDKPLVMPEGWYNEGKGGINITAGSNSVLVDNYTGSMSLKTGDTLVLQVNLLLTPFKTIDTDKQWSTRFYHKYNPVDTIRKYGANTINIHHANEINPWINYPFLEPAKMKAFIDEAHSKGMKVKIYNTIRELSNHAPEIFAIRSLGHEVFSPGSGNGFNWLQEHLGDDYIAAWFVPDLKDAAIINSGMSRWHNYYIEGMNWLTKEIGIDGLYLDDVAFDRTTMKRLRKVLDTNREGALIDLHSANQYNVRDGFTNSANLYMEHFPYLNRLWFGEYFDRNMAADFWLVEMSGIPFGLMGEMLQDGGNQYRGMLYGMTSRAPWSGDPSALWKAWDDFGMKGTRMTGYWSENCPVSSSFSTIPATVYSKEGGALIALASWDSQSRDVRLDIDWAKLGLDKSECEILIPAIKNFQEEQKIKPGETVNIRPAEGKIIIVKSK